MSVVTRFPPSPTGYFHIGSARTALFNYLFTLHHKGAIYLRFEDTYKERSKREYEDDIIAGLAWLGIEYASPKIARQSERAEVYKKYFKTLLEKGLAYEAEESQSDPGKKVVRFKNPNIPITFNDLIRGPVTFHTGELGDFVIAKNTEEPLYHLAVVIDDYEMGVTHVIRGEDHISNTPRQILILEALGFPRPEYAHIPLILAPARSKLSKRHGAVSVNEFRKAGYLPEAFVNYLALLGWHPGGDQEIFSLSELAERFTLEQVQKSGAIFDETKLKWFNREHILKLSAEAFLASAKEFLSEKTVRGLSKAKLLESLVPLMRERIQTFGELADLDNAGEFDFYFVAPEYEKESLLWKKDPSVEKTAERLRRIQALLELVPKGDWHDKKLKDILWPYAESEGRGEVLWPLRFALSGREKSPDPFVIAGMIGKDETLKRVEAAIGKLG